MPAHTITVEPGFNVPAMRSASAPSSPGARSYSSAPSSAASAEAKAPANPGT